MTTPDTERELISPAWEPVSEEPGYKWVSENVELPPDSELKQFDFELFPLARFVLDQLCHNEYLRRFTEMLSAQVGKTVTILAYVCWKIKNKPAGLGWYTDTGINAKGDYNTKILTMLEGCPAVAKLLPSDRTKKNNTLIQFGFMSLRVMGAESRRNREGKTITEVLCDEVRNYPQGAMEQIDNRFKTITNYRRILFSSAGDLMTEPWLSFKKGSRHMGFWNCPGCGHKQTFRFGKEASPLYPESRKKGGFVWADNSRTHPSDDVYNLLELVKTIRYQCESCERLFTESEKLQLIRSVQFEQTNPMADPADISVHCWEAYMPFAGCSWASIVSKFLNALVTVRQGNIEPMKVFITETLGEPWEERAEKPIEGEIVKRCGEYSVGEEWPTDPKRICGVLSVDMQHGFLHVLYRQHTILAESRLIERIKLVDLAELRVYQLAKKVKDRAVGIDCSGKAGAEVLRACVQHGMWVPDPKGGRDHIWNGWLPLMGDDAAEFNRTIHDKHGNSMQIKTFWKEVLVEANIGMAGRQKPIHRYSWSNSHYKEELFWRKLKGIGPLWEIPKNIDPDYFKQIQSVEWRELRDAEGKVIGIEWKEKGRHDDSDCEQEQLVIADINGIGKGV